VSYSSAVQISRWLIDWLIECVLKSWLNDDNDDNDDDDDDDDDLLYIVMRWKWSLTYVLTCYECSTYTRRTRTQCWVSPTQCLLNTSRITRSQSLSVCLSVCANNKIHQWFYYVQFEKSSDISVATLCLIVLISVFWVCFECAVDVFWLLWVLSVFLFF